MAILVPRHLISLSAADVLSFCDGKLARYKCPKRVVFADALLRNAKGKVLKPDLRARYLEGDPTAR